MNLIIQNIAHDSIDALFQHLAKYSIKNAIKITDKIYEHISHLKFSPNIGRYVPSISDKHFREFIYQKYKNSYRIIYYISKTTNTIYILYIADCKQDFNHILKQHNNFNNFLKL